MQKTAETSVQIIDPLKNRWSPRAFADKAVESEKLKALFEAARWTMSGYNAQPWRFIVGVKGDDNYENVLNSLNEWNQKWAQSAPVLLLVVGEKISSFNGKENGTYKYDCGAAAAMLTAQASALDLYCHQMGGILPDKAREIFKIPAEFEPLTGMAIGYMGELSRIDESYHEDELKPRSRKALSEIVFGASWGEGKSL
jgi:nitroreductase